jgi:hypothetical protein
MESQKQNNTTITQTEAQVYGALLAIARLRTALQNLVDAVNEMDGTANMPYHIAINVAKANIYATKILQETDDDDH